MRLYSLWSKAKYQLRQVAAHRVIILLYHRVTELPADPEWLCVTPRQFEQHLQVIRRHYQPLALYELPRRLAAGRLPRKAVVITFDDGYSDNLYQAKPLLEKYNIPATVFVTSGKINSPTELWWDELAHILLESPHLPGDLSLTINGTDYHWPLPNGANGASVFAGRWNVAQSTCPTPRHRAYKELAPLVRPLPAAGREAILSRLAQWANLPRQVRPSHSLLDDIELIQLTGDGLVDAGAHTVTHPVLAAQPPAQQQREIVESKRHLEEILGRPVTAFSYPFGGLAHYAAQTAAFVQQAGFTCACSNFPGWTRPNTDPFQLPRYLVRDWDGDIFARHLERWFRG